MSGNIVPHLIYRDTNQRHRFLQSIPDRWWLPQPQQHDGVQQHMDRPVRFAGRQTTGPWQDAVLNRSCLLQGLLVQTQHPPDASIYPLGSAWLISNLCCISAPSILAPQLQDLDEQETESLPRLLVCPKALFVHGGERQFWVQRKAQQTLYHSSL